MFTLRRSLFALPLLLIACEGPAGPPGATGTNGNNGTNGNDGKNGLACWDLNANDKCDVSTEDATADGKCDVSDCRGQPGQPGQPGAGYLALEPKGVVGFVRDLAGRPAINAKIYLVPTTDIPTAPINISPTDIAAVRADPNDEPLEDTLAAKGSSYAQAVTDPNGIYRIPTVAAGKFFLVAMPDAAAGKHLPGGSLCRIAYEQKDLIGKQWDIEVSTTPSAKATYVGPSVCLNCHGVVHELSTAHMLGIQKVGKPGPLQDMSRFPDWDRPLKTKFTTQGTWIYFFGYGGNVSSPGYKVSETDPGTGVSFKAKMYGDGNGKYFVDLVNVKDSGQPAATYEVEMTYGGGIYKQRYMAKLSDGSRYVLPIQFNYEGATSETGVPASRWVWNQYNAQNWYDESKQSAQLKAPPKSKAFDNNCAGCHFSGYRLTGDSTSGWKAHGVPDPMGEMDYDGDGKLETMNISCETCHGPGSEHWARAGNGNAIVSPRLLTPEREVAICSQCHTRALGIGGGNTEAPMSTAGLMPRAGISRKELLTSHMSKLDDGIWDNVKGDGKSPNKHHQQATDFLRTKKYRNTNYLMGCSDCHDPHGVSGLNHQLQQGLDSPKDGSRLCMTCHDKTFPAGTSLGARMQAHWSSKGIANIDMGNDIRCSDCHVAKTAKSGTGKAQATIAGVTYYWGDISSHLFDVPLRADIQQSGKGPEMMAIPYTSSCAQGCHSKAP